jgi:hypothetical protein
MTQTLPAILAALAAQRDLLTVWNEAIAQGFADRAALYADKNAMDTFVAAHDQRTKAMAPLHAWLDAQVRAALATAAAAGGLQTLPKGISTPFVDRWNSMLTEANPAAFITDDVVSALVAVLRKAIGFDTGVVAKLDAEGIERLIATGTTDRPYRCDDDMLVDFWSGMNFLLSIDNWQPTIHQRIGKAEATKPAQPRPDTLVFQAKLEAPTGRLIVADRLPFDACQAVIDDVGEAFHINYGLHRLLRTSILMGTHNVMQISVGNTDPSFHVEGGTVLVGRAQNRTRHARTCTDLWMATAADAATLHAMGVDEADIAQAIAEGEVSEVQVAPGTWHVFWSEDASAETTARRFAPLYEHADGDEVHVWMTQDPADVLALDTIKVFSSTLGTHA